MSSYLPPKIVWTLDGHPRGLLLYLEGEVLRGFSLVSGFDFSCPDQKLVRVSLVDGELQFYIYWRGQEEKDLQRFFYPLDGLDKDEHEKILYIFQTYFLKSSSRPLPESSHLSQDKDTIPNLVWS